MGRVNDTGVGECYGVGIGGSVKAKVAVAMRLRRHWTSIAENLYPARIDTSRPAAARTPKTERRAARKAQRDARKAQRR
jgi:hypothetical protein